MRNRVVMTDEGKGLNYLCEGYKQFFHYADPYLKLIVRELRQRKHPHAIRKSIQAMYEAQWKGAKRNDPCPCGSGKKYKKCCFQ